MLEAITYAACGTGFTYLMTTLGAAIVFLFVVKMNPNIERSFLGFASGVMIAASVWSLIIPAIDFAEENGQLGWIPPVVGIILGVLFIMSIDALISRLKRFNGKENDIPAKKQTLLLFIAITLHNIPEGMAVGLSFALAAQTNSDYAGAIALALGIGIQNFPEGAAVSLPLRRCGMSRTKSFLCGSLSGIVEPIFGVIVVLIASFASHLLPYFLSFAAGSMLYVVVKELIPEANSNKKTNIGTISIIIGFLIMMTLDVALG